MTGRLPALLAAVSLAVATPAIAQVKLGLAAPLTGPDAGFGQGLRQGAEQAVADINKAGGIAGQRLQLVVLDDGSEIKQGIAVARRFASSGVKLVVGHLTSGVSAATLPVYDEAGILAISPGASFAPSAVRGAWNLFRLSGTDAQQGAAAAAWLAARYRDRPVAIVHDKTSFGRGLADEVARGLKSRDGREALFEGVTRGDKDVSALVAKIRAVRAEAVYFGGLSAEAALLARALREAGVSAPLMGSDGILDKDFPQAAGPGAEGTLMTLPPERRLPEPKGAPSKTPRPPEAETFAAPAYAAVEILKLAAEGANSTDPRRIAEFLHAGAPMRTAIGEVAFDGKGDLAKPPFVMTVWRKTPDGRIDYAGNEVSP